ncbi:hypothetical protein SBRY_60138 [Actinacidiphila bryophytorum]|uniref:Uncharacterized protein n=1 Tax=Actinacidiphila bryophytorum TaxID=1436133 RepID=A0A9W4H5Z6_9ACTN|nr:hypothetical protein SBRY_60138 [Actinacidiphila bryophytorum]
MLRSPHVPAREVRCPRDRDRPPSRRPAPPGAAGSRVGGDAPVRDAGLRGDHGRRDRGHRGGGAADLLPALQVQGRGDLPRPRRHAGAGAGRPGLRGPARAPAGHRVPRHHRGAADVRAGARGVGGALPADPRGADAAGARDRLGGPLRAALHPLPAGPLRRGRAGLRRRRPAAGRGRRLRGGRRAQPRAAPLAAGGRQGRRRGAARPRLRRHQGDLRHRHRRGADTVEGCFHDPRDRLPARRGGGRRGAHRRLARADPAQHRGGAAQGLRRRGNPLTSGCPAFRAAAVARWGHRVHTEKKKWHAVSLRLARGAIRYPQSGRTACGDPSQADCPPGPDACVTRHPAPPRGSFAPPPHLRRTDDGTSIPTRPQRSRTLRHAERIAGGESYEGNPGRRPRTGQYGRGLRGAEAAGVVPRGHRAQGRGRDVRRPRNPRQGPSHLAAPGRGAGAGDRPRRGADRCHGQLGELQLRLDLDLRARVDLRLPGAVRPPVAAGPAARPAVPRDRLGPVGRRTAHRPRGEQVAARRPGRRSLPVGGVGVGRRS